MNQMTLPISEPRPGVRPPHDRPAERPQAEERDPRRGDAERDRDDEDQHDQRGERVAGGHHEAAEHEPDQIQNEPHGWSRLVRSG
jgi:hypothetical protein